MLLRDGPLTFREFMTHEEVPLAIVFREVLQFLATRKDAALFGAQAVNAYVATERMTHDLDVLSTDAAALAEDLRKLLAERFHIAARVREVVKGTGYRVYQARKPKNRNLVDVRRVDALPPINVIDGVQVLEPVELVAMKVVSLAERQHREKGLSDRLDLHRLLNAFPEFRGKHKVVSDRLRALGASDAALALWHEIVREPIEPDEDEDGVD